MRWTLAPLVLASCVQAFGLGDPTRDDRDGDHVVDSLDNCPDTFNPDQSDINNNGIGDACDGCVATTPDDSDHDGIPDACDGCDNRLPDDNGDGIPDACEMQMTTDPCPNCQPCALGPPHDEDHDTIADACDLCPAIPDPSNGDVDQDGVGTPCDSDDNAPSEEQIFDAFAEPNLAWYTDGPWIIANDRATVTIGAVAPVRVSRTLGTAIPIFTITTHVDVQVGGDHDTHAGVFASPTQDPGDQLAINCTLDQATGGTLVSMATLPGQTVSTTLDPAPGYTITMVRDLDSVLCIATPDGGGAASPVGALVGGAISFYQTGLVSRSMGTVSFDYFDVVTRRH